MRTRRLRLGEKFDNNQALLPFIVIELPGLSHTRYPVFEDPNSIPSGRCMERPISASVGVRQLSQPCQTNRFVPWNGVARWHRNRQDLAVRRGATARLMPAMCENVTIGFSRRLRAFRLSSGDF